MDNYDTACAKIGLIIKDSNIDNSFESIRSVSDAILNVITSTDTNLINDKYTDAYIQKIVKDKVLGSKYTPIRSFRPKPVCCAMYGVWSAAPFLFERGIIGDGKEQVSISVIVNFCWDLLDSVLPDGMDNLKELETGDSNERQD